MDCIDTDGVHYSLLQDATLIDAGEELARSLRIPVRSRLLVGVFAKAIEHTSNPDTRSAVCLYTLQEIEQKFAQNIHMCYNGSVSTRNMDYIAGNLQECPTKVRTPMMQIKETGRHKLWIDKKNRLHEPHRIFFPIRL